MKKKSLLLTAVATIGLAAATMAQNLPSYVPTNGLDGWWSFNGNSNDLSGNGNNGTINDATLTTDRSGNPNSAYAFNGSSSYISLSNPFFNGSTSVSSFSYFAEFKINQLPAAGAEYSISNKEGFWRTLSLVIYDNGSLSYGGSQPNPQGYISVISPTGTINPNQWYCVVVNFENSILSLYIDGQLISSSTVNYTNFDFSWQASGNSTSTNSLGAAHPVSPGITNYFNGVLDNFGTWNRALSLSERNSLCQNCQLIFTTQPNSQNININNNAQFIVDSSDPNSTFQWQTDIGVGFQNLNSVGQYSGTTNDTLIVANITLSNNNQPFRCIINSGFCSDTSNVALLTVNNNVGINENMQDNLFSVFPNPSQTVINVKADSKLIGELYTIIDNTGRAVLSGKIAYENMSIELGSLSNGFYVFQVKDKINQSFRIIKN
jgi:hypothetical protein